MTVYFRVQKTDDLIREAAEPFRYPGGELHLKNVSDYAGDDAVFVADVRFGYDVVTMIDGERDLTLAHAFANVAHQRQRPFVLMLPYLPAARSDRSEPVGHEPVGVAVYAQRVMAMNPQQVISVDVHSPAAEMYMQPKLTALDSFPLLQEALTASEHVKYDAVIAPDKGAVARAESVAERLSLDCYHAEKHRDFDTGKITGIKMGAPLPPSGRYLVVDDICDAGGTFIGLADATGVPKEQLGLWVTHYTGNDGALRLREKYGRIYTTDSHALAHRLVDGVAVADVIVPCETYMWQNIRNRLFTHNDADRLEA